MTNYRKSLCGIGDAACKLCVSVCESALHALTEYPAVKRMWEKIVPSDFTKKNCRRLARLDYCEHELSRCNSRLVQYLGYRISCKLGLEKQGY